MRWVKWALTALVTVSVGVVVLVQVRSGSEENYSVPNDVCGVPVTPSIIKPLLPVGNEIEQAEEEIQNPENFALLLCVISVDGPAALNVDVYQLTNELSVMEYYEAAPSAYGISSPYEVVIGGQEAVISSGGSLVQMPCPPKGDDAVLQINVRNYAAESETEGGRESIQRFTEDFMASAKAEYGC